MQGYYSLVNFLWDADNDGYLSYTVDTPKFFAIATLYYIYYDWNTTLILSTYIYIILLVVCFIKQFCYKFFFSYNKLILQRL